VNHRAVTCVKRVDHVDGSADARTDKSPLIRRQRVGVAAVTGLTFIEAANQISHVRCLPVHEDDHWRATLTRRRHGMTAAKRGLGVDVHDIQIGEPWLRESHHDSAPRREADVAISRSSGRRLSRRTCGRREALRRMTIVAPSCAQPQLKLKPDPP
jgi:hypothetical protein